jgi:putative ABC transport system substrate-binding protein
VRRREFIACLGGAVMLPPVARAQPSATPVIGFVSARSSEESAVHTAAFLRGLEEVGFVAGQNVTIEYAWAEGHYDRLPALASDLVRRKVAVIAAVGGIPSALAVKAATMTVPVVFLIGDDPVQVGLVKSLNRPGGNITGVTLIATELGGKRLELLNEIAPGPSPVAVLINPTNPQLSRARP